MRINHQLTTPDNFTFIKAENRLLAEMVTMFLGGGTHLYNRMLEELERGGEYIAQLVLNAL